MTEDPTLTAWCFDQPAGTLRGARQGLSFAYEPSWIADGMPPLSHALPLTGEYSSTTVRAFFGGLLPEGEPRKQLARQLGISVTNDFALLAAIAGDTAGAVSLLPPGTRPESGSGDVRWLSDDELIQVIDELPTRPMHADEDGEYRLSLAGAQDKLPVVVGDDGRIGLTRGQTPSTHILKTPIERLHGTVANEGFCLAFGRALGIETAAARPHRFRDHEFLLVERYDRQESGEGVRRLHQEDFCQALGIPTAEKYQAEGGPSLARCFALLREASDVPALDVNRLLDIVTLNLLVGNHDAHGKNFSLLYVPQTPRARLAPAYDVLSTIAYRHSHSLTRKMAMSVGGVYNPEYLEPRHLEQLVGDAGLALAGVRRRLRAYADAAPEAARATADRFADEGWDDPILATVADVIERRAKLLATVSTATPDGRRPTSGRRVRIGQHWRRVDPGAALPSVIAVLGVDADDHVRVTVRAGRDGPIERRTFTVTDFEAFVLLDDPSWPSFLVAAGLDPDDPRAEVVTRTGGELMGARSAIRAPGGLGGPETCWRIVAATESEALRIVARIVGPGVAVRPAPAWEDEP